VVLGGVRHRRRAVLGEQQRVAVEGDRVGQVEPRLREGLRLAPRIGGHQLRVRLHREVDLARRAGVAQRQADEQPAGVAGDEVGALDGQAGAAADRHAGVAPAACEPLGAAEPDAVDPEPDAVEELDRRRPDAAHLAAGVEAHGGIAPGLGRHLVGARAATTNRRSSRRSPVESSAAAAATDGSASTASATALTLNMPGSLPGREGGNPALGACSTSNAGYGAWRSCWAAISDRPPSITTDSPVR
jgi:hypothetical protein